MIQRIQSIYLLAATSLQLLFFYNPVSRISVSDAYLLEMGVFQIEPVAGVDGLIISVWPFTSLVIASMLIGLITLFSYKKRGLQMRLCMFNIFLMLGMPVLIWYFTRFALRESGGLESYYLWPVVIPFISAVFTYLALNSIRKDDALIKSYERIR